MSSQKQVRDLFGLPKKEAIFDDFGCVLRTNIPHHGRMYLTENCLCFYSSLIGINKKIIIPLSDITKIVKAKKLGILRAIKVYQQGVEKSFAFTNFSNSDTTFLIIHRLWSNVSPHAEQNNEEVEEDAEDLFSTLEQTDMDIKLQKDTGTFIVPVELRKEQPNHHSVLSGEHGSVEKDQKAESQEYQNVGNTKEEDISIQTEKCSSKDVITDLDKMDLKKSPAKTSRQTERLEEQTKFISSITSGKSPINKNFEKAQVLGEIQGTGDKDGRTHSDRIQKEQGHNDVSKEDLDRLMEGIPLAEGHEEILKVHLAMSTKDCFNTLLVDNSPNSLEKFYIEKGEQKVVGGEWKEPELGEEYEGKPVLMSAQLSVELQIKNNPFVKVSPTTKYYKLLEKNDTKIVIRVLSKCTGVPYADTFATEEEWVIVSPAPNVSACSLRITFHIIFYKSTIFRSKIQAGALQGTTEVWTDWNEWLKKKGLIFKEKKQPGAANKLTHGIEKSNKIFERNKESPTTIEAAKKTLKEMIVEQSIITRSFIIENRTDLLLGVILLLLLQLYSKMSNIELVLKPQSNETP